LEEGKDAPDYDDAIEIMDEFIKKVGQAIKRGNIQGDDGAILISSAEQVILALEAEAETSASSFTITATAGPETFIFDPDAGEFVEANGSSIGAGAGSVQITDTLLQQPEDKAFAIDGDEWVGIGIDRDRLYEHLVETLEAAGDSGFDIWAGAAFVENTESNSLINPPAKMD